MPNGTAALGVHYTLVAQLTPFVHSFLLMAPPLVCLGRVGWHWGVVLLLRCARLPLKAWAHVLRTHDQGNELLRCRHSVGPGLQHRQWNCDVIEQVRPLCLRCLHVHCISRWRFSSPFLCTFRGAGVHQRTLTMRLCEQGREVHIAWEVVGLES